MILVDRLLAGGIGFVLDKIAAAVDSELNDEERLREELLAAQMQNELGELSDEEFAELEAELLARLREIRERQRGEREASLAGVVGVEVSFDSGSGDMERHPERSEGSGRGEQAESLLRPDSSPRSK